MPLKIYIAFPVLLQLAKFIKRKETQELLLIILLNLYSKNYPFFEVPFLFSAILASILKVLSEQRRQSQGKS